MGTRLSSPPTQGSRMGARPACSPRAPPTPRPAQGQGTPHPLSRVLPGGVVSHQGLRGLLSPRETNAAGLPGGSLGRTERLLLSFGRLAHQTVPCKGQRHPRESERLLGAALGPQERTWVTASGGCRPDASEADGRATAGCPGHSEQSLTVHVRLRVRGERLPRHVQVSALSAVRTGLRGAEGVRVSPAEPCTGASRNPLAGAGGSCQVFRDARSIGLRLLGRCSLLDRRHRGPAWHFRGGQLSLGQASWLGGQRAEMVSVGEAPWSPTATCARCREPGQPETRCEPRAHTCLW